NPPVIRWNRTSRICHGPKSIESGPIAASIGLSGSLGLDALAGLTGSNLLISAIPLRVVQNAFLLLPCSPRRASRVSTAVCCLYQQLPRAHLHKSPVQTCRAIRCGILLSC